MTRMLSDTAKADDYYGCDRCHMYISRDAKWKGSGEPVATNVCPNCLRPWDFVPAELPARRV